MFVVCGPGPGSDHILGKGLLDWIADVKKKLTHVGAGAFLSNTADSETMEDRYFQLNNSERLHGKRNHNQREGTTQTSLAKSLLGRGQSRVKIYTMQNWQVDKKGTNDPMEKWAKDSQRQFTGEYTQMTKQMKSCSDALLGREMQIKTVRYHFIPLNLVKTNKTNNKSCWWVTGQRWLSNHWGDMKCYSLWGNQAGNSY